MGNIMTRRCPKCGKTFTSSNNVCPFCNPKTAVAIGTMNFIGSVLKCFGNKK